MKALKPFSKLMEWGSYPNQTLLCVGMKKKQVAGILKRMAPNDTVFLKEFEKIEDPIENGANGAIFVKDGKTVLMMRPFVDEWSFWETMIHETAHLVHNVLGRSRGMMDEDEARAYQQQYLFKTMRRAIMIKYGIIKCANTGKATSRRSSRRGRATSRRRARTSSR